MGERDSEGYSPNRGDSEGYPGRAGEAEGRPRESPTEEGEFQNEALAMLYMGFR